MREAERIDQAAGIRKIVMGALNGLSLRQASNKTGIHYSTIYNLSRGQRVNHASTIAFGRAFGVLDELLKASGYTYETPVIDPFSGAGGFASQVKHKESVTLSPPYGTQYTVDPDALMIAEAYEDLPPEIKKFVKTQILSAADMAEALGQTKSAKSARAMEQKMTVGGTRADQNDNPSRLSEDRIPADDDGDREGGA